MVRVGISISRIDGLNVCRRGPETPSRTLDYKVQPRCTVEMCKKLQNWTLDEWKQLLWSDESSFNLYQWDGRVWV
ncbi:hypothetical protein TNCV_2429221 [Trichonephila clavipes]|nr:hypothetical protein TNCV_2429221 [Trichonephila clavipes]